MNGHLAPGTPRQYAGDTHSRRAGAARQRLAGAAFPHAHGDVVGAIDFDKLDIDLAREHLRDLDLRADAEHQFISDLIDVNDAVRVAHRHAGALEVGWPYRHI